MTVPVRWLTPKIAIAGQLHPDQAVELAQMGFKSIVCNRPDHEYGPDQPTAEEIRLAVEKAGMVFAFHPVAGDGGTAEDAKEMGRLINALPLPLLSYCYSGGRCVALISLTARLGLAIPN